MGGGVFYCCVGWIVVINLFGGLWWCGNWGGLRIGYRCWNEDWGCYGWWGIVGWGMFICGGFSWERGKDCGVC